MAIIVDNNTPIFNGLSGLYTNVILSGGNVGVGTSTPSSLLTVGNASTRGTVTVNGSTAAAPYFQLLDNQGSGRAFALYSGRVASTFTVEDTTGANAVRLAIDSSGRVGFGGQTAPGYTVDVTGSINFTGNLYQNGVIYGGGSGGGAAGGLYVPLSGTNGGAMYGPLSSTNTAFFSSIGINVTTTTGLLELSGGQYNTGIILKSPSTNGTGLNLQNTDTGGHNWYAISTGSNNGGGAGNLGFYDATASSYYFYIKGSSGNVGINTTSPGARLDVRGTLLAGTAGSSTRSTDGVTIDIDYNTAYSANTDVGDSGRFLSIVNESTSNNRFAQLGFRVNPNGGSNNAMLDFKFVNTQSYTSKLVASYLGSGGGWYDRQVYYNTGKVEFSGDLFFPLAGIGGATTNYATPQGWVAANPTTGAQTGYFDTIDPSFQVNGATTENKLTWALTPYSSPGLTWASINDVGNDADGGWNKYVNGLSSAKSYRSIVWVRRTNASTSGNFYFGCDGGNTLNLDGTVNSNPYFFAVGLATLPVTNRWYLAVGYIHAYADGSTTSYSKIYDSTTGQSVYSGTDYKMANGATRQMHRTYLYYSTDTNSNLEWWGPRFEEINGNEPAISGMLFELITSPTFTGSVTTPILYDYNNTGYYVDPASTSNMNTIVAGGDVTANRYRGQNSLVLNSYTTVNPSSNVYLYSPPNDRDAWIYLDSADTSSNWGIYHRQIDSSVGSLPANSIGFVGAGSSTLQHYMTLVGGSSYSSGDKRAPIFYDSDNTGYYLNPASTSNLNVVGATGRIWAGWDAGDNNSVSCSNWFRSNGSSGWYNASYDGGIHMIDSTYVRVYNKQFYSAAAISTGTSVYSPIFYDNNDSGYYLDLNSTSDSAMRIRGGALHGPNTSWGNYLWVGSNGRPDSNACVATTNGNLHLDSQNGRTLFLNYYSGNDIQSRIIYSVENTAYYINSYSDSRLNTALFNSLRILSSTGDLANGAPWYGYGISNISSNGYYMGQLAFYYGLRLRAQSTIVDLDNTSNFGNGWMWVNNGFAVANQIRGTSYYDYNDTGYYMDLNSAYATNFQGFTSYSKMRVGLTGRYNTARNDYTGDSAYWGGQMGWGTVDLNTINDWGCGFWDSWGNPGNQPSGTSHWDGINVQHATPYGWQLAVGAGAPELFYIRGHWGGGWTSWYNIMLYENNNNANRAFYGAVFYDNNNTGYYCDPASTSNFNVLNTQGRLNVAEYVYSTNGCGRIYLPGNLHIDAFCGHSIYLNYYSNAYTRFFGHSEHNGYGIYGVNELYASIWYDRDNSGYYINPNGTSYVNSFITNDWFRVDGAGGLVFSSYGYGIYSAHSGGSTYGNVSTFGTGRSGWSGYSIGRWSFMSNYGDYWGIHDQNRSWMTWWDGGNHRWQYGSAIFQDMAVQAITYYDYYNTGYYIVPRGGSRMASVTIDTIYLSGNTGNYITEGWGTRLASPGGQWPCKVQNSLIVGGLNWDGTDFGGGNIFATGSINAYWSDGRLKKNVEVISDALDKVMKLRGVTFEPDIEKAKELGANPCQIDQGREAGLIAQEVQAVLPEVVRIAPFDMNDGKNGIFESKSGDNYLTLQYERVVGLLVEAIKELNHKVDDLKAEVKTLKGG